MPLQALSPAIRPPRAGGWELHWKREAPPPGPRCPLCRSRPWTLAAVMPARTVRGRFFTRPQDANHGHVKIQNFRTTTDSKSEANGQVTNRTKITAMQKPTADLHPEGLENS